MIIITYDISDNSLRTKFSRFLSKFGYRLQYSVYEIKNSKRMLALIEVEIREKFSKKFGETDSVMVFNLSKQCKIKKYGYAVNDDEDLIIIS